MTQEEVIALMESSKDTDEWNANCDKVQAACGGGYPSFWYTAIVASGLSQRASARWNDGGDDKIHISVMRPAA